MINDIVMNDNGEMMSRVSLIYQNTCAFLEELAKEEIEGDRPSGRKAPTYSYRIRAWLYSEFDRFDIIPDETALKLTREEIRIAKREFFKLVNLINRYFDFAPMKQDFACYMGITVNAYNLLMTDGFPEQKLEMQDIDSRISALQLSYAQAGKGKEKSTEFVLTSKNFGHSIQKAPEAIVFDATDSVKFSVSERMKVIAEMQQSLALASPSTSKKKK